MYKSLAEIALPITEEEYRNDGCLHYSLLADYERKGFVGIPTLGEKKDTPSLTFGSIVDVLLTGSQEEFNKQFLVAEFCELKPMHLTCVKALFDRYHLVCNNLAKLSDEQLLTVADEVEFGKAWKTSTRLDSIRKECAEYYNLMILAEGKKVIDTETYNDAVAAVNALKESPATKAYFAPNNPFDNTLERLYQLKFRANFDGLDYSCMMDLAVVNHKTKTIYPCDLKTSSHMEYEFYKSFLDWNYDVQSRQYAAIIKANIEKDEYFKDFKIMPYRFIVVNRKSLNPLVWEWPHTFADTDIVVTTSKGYPIKLRNFKTIGRELAHYQETQQKVPDGITNKPNNIQNWIEKM